MNSDKVSACIDRTEALAPNDINSNEKVAKMEHMSMT